MKESNTFKVWFGASEVVDGDGTPKVVYHGTQNGDFTIFSQDMKGRRTHHGAADVGFHFTDNLAIAETFSEGYRLESIEVYRKMFGQEPTGTKIQIKAIAVSGGHDGVIQFKRDGSIGDLVAFSATQINFAIGNTCRFHQENPDICISTPHSASHNDHFIGICNADENDDAFKLRERQRG